MEADSVQRRQLLERRLAEHFGSSGGPATLWVRAPGRVDLMGSHTDYNEGHVLAVALDLDTWIAARPRRGRQARLYSLNLEQQASFRLDEPASPGRGWGGFVQGVVQLLRQQGLALPGFDAVVHGSLPLGGGLSSSASLSVAVARLGEALCGERLPALALARLCQRAEHDFAGVRCGLLDPCCALFGRADQALLLDCRSLDCTHRRLPPELRLLVADTREPRQLAVSAYGERRQQCEQGVAALRSALPQLRALRDVTPAELATHGAQLPAEVARRCRFVVEEQQRVHALAQALAANDREAMARLCAASFAGARDLYEICVPSMEALHAALDAAPGCIGARQAGAGFGGCMVALVDAPRLEDCVRSAAASFRAHFGREARFHAVRAAEAAGPLPPLPG